jgi:hydrogenase accessory protein HypB
MERVPLERKVLSENDRIAADLRARFQEHGIFCLNLINSPGSGKTSLLERTLESLPKNDRVAVLTGDIQTEDDATHLKRFHFPVKQITTGGTSLDARMIERRLEAALETTSFVILRTAVTLMFTGVRSNCDTALVHRGSAGTTTIDALGGTFAATASTTTRSGCISNEGG